MKYSGFNLKVALITFLVSLVIILSLQYYQAERNLIKPLYKELGELDELEGLKISRNLLKNNSRIEIEFSLQENVPFYLTIEKIQKVLANERNDFLIRFNDTRTDNLRFSLQKMRFALEEGISTGEYYVLQERIGQLSEDLNIDWELGFDQDYLYLQLSDETGFLVEVFPRNELPKRIVMQAKGRGNR